MAIVSDQQLKLLLADTKTQRKGFELMVRQFSEQLYWQIRRIVMTHEDTNDILQNTFLKAWNGLESFHGDAKLLTWLSRIAVNESLDFIRKQKVKPTVDADFADLGVAQQLMADDYFEVIAQLPEVQRTVFMLRYYDEMKYSEISRITGTSEGALKASYHIAVKKISEFFRSRD